MPRVSASLALLALLLTACSSDKPKAVYEEEDFTQNHTYSRSFESDYKVACDAGRRALLSQGYNIDKSASDTVSGHKNFMDATGRNTQITFNVNCAPDSTGPSHSQVFANAVQDSYTLKKSSTAASVGVGILGSVSLPFSSQDDSLVKTSTLTVTRPQFYGGFFDLLRQYLAVAQLEQPEAPKKKPTPAPVPALVTPTVPLTPENTGIAKPPVEPAPQAPAPKTDAAPASPEPAAEAPAAPALAPAPAATQPAAAPAEGVAAPSSADKPAAAPPAADKPAE
ncbi:MAG TPA: DUF2242 domain-containing protein [Bordetella sp.]